MFRPNTRFLVLNVALLAVLVAILCPAVTGAGYRCRVVNGSYPVPPTKAEEPIEAPEPHVPPLPPLAKAEEVPAPPSGETEAPAPLAEQKPPKVPEAPKPAPAKQKLEQPPPASNSGASVKTGGGYDQSGDATHYTVGMGACGKTNSDSELVCAVGAPIYGVHANPNNAPICGQCIEISGPKGVVKVRVVDRCPVCAAGDLDLSPTAFQQAVGELGIGRHTVSWKFVSC